MENLTLRKLITILLLVVACGVIFLSAWSYQATNKIKIGSDLYQDIIEANDLVADILPPPQYIVEAFLLIHQMRSAAVSEQVALKKRFNETYDEFLLGQQRWRKSELPKPLFDAITAGTGNPAAAFYKEAEQTFFPAMASGNPEAIESSIKKLEIYYQQNRTAVNELVVASSARKIQLEKITLGEMSQYRFWFYFVAMLVVALSLFIAMKVVAIIRGRLSALVSAVKQVGEGNLCIKVNASIQDELGDLAGAINTMVAQFNQVVTQLKDMAEQLSVAAVQSANLCGQGVENVHQQHLMASQLASGMTQMSLAIETVSQGATETLTRVGDARMATGQGIQNMEAHVNKVHAIASNIQRAANHVEQLSELSNTIGSVLDVIRGVAEQTNLLALNAAIEAARAGEQGRGFAVVADEVRTLASRTGQSTTEIQEMIERLQTSTHDAAKEMIFSRDEAKKGVEDVTHVGHLLKNLSLAVEKIHSMNFDMAQSAEEQASVTREFDRSLQMMKVLADKSLSGIKEIQSTAENLSAMAIQQNNFVKQFHLD